MATIKYIVPIALILCGASFLSAQTPPPAQPRAEENSHGLSRVKPAELANALDQYALVQARRMLQLTDGEYQQVLPRFKNLQQTRRRNTVARNRLVQELRRLVGARATGEADEKTIAAAVGALREHDERAFRELQAAYDAVDEALTPRQRARLRLFEENIEARKLDLVMRARSRAPGGG